MASDNMMLMMIDVPAEPKPMTPRDRQKGMALSARSVKYVTTPLMHTTMIDSMYAFSLPYLATYGQANEHERAHESVWRCGCHTTLRQLKSDATKWAIAYHSRCNGHSQQSSERHEAHTHCQPSVFVDVQHVLKHERVQPGELRDHTQQRVGVR
jgi:hypothetical protein